MARSSAIPQRFFSDEAWHRAAYPGIADFVRQGHAESAFDSYCRGGHPTRPPHWLFDEAYYRRRYADLADEILLGAELVNGYDHYLRHGNLEGRIGHPLFDPEFYCNELEPEGAALARAKGPFQHYLRRIETRTPEPRTTPFCLPVVATELLRGQLGWEDGRELLVADATDPALFARQIVRLYRDEALWTALREAALEQLRNENSRKDYVAAIEAVLGPPSRG